MLWYRLYPHQGPRRKINVFLKAAMVGKIVNPRPLVTHLAPASDLSSTYLPRHLGGRFSTKARGPSMKSSDISIF